VGAVVASGSPRKPFILAGILPTDVDCGKSAFSVRDLFVYNASI
jgi:hypothetical protein